MLAQTDTRTEDGVDNGGGGGTRQLWGLVRTDAEDAGCGPGHRPWESHPAGAAPLDSAAPKLHVDKCQLF